MVFSYYSSGETMKGLGIDSIKNMRIILSESVHSFIRNNDQRSAASLALYTALALIPALFLLTYLIGLVIGSSNEAFQKTEEIVKQFIPQFSNIVLREVRSVTEYKKTLGIVNLIILIWLITPLIATVRTVFDEILRTGVQRHILVTKLHDLLKTAAILLFFIATSTVALMGLALRIARKLFPEEILPSYFSIIVPFLFAFVVFIFFYSMFLRRVRTVHVLTGALAATLLWSIMRPAFNLILAYNPQYGYTFGSLKSIFIVILWIYYSQCVFLFGAEIISVLHHKGPILIRRLIAGKKNLPGKVWQEYVVTYAEGSTIFHHGAAGNDMFYLLKGLVSIRKDEKELGRILPGRYFGEMAFLLSEPRVASAVALQDTELVIINNRNMKTLIRESPDLIWEILEEMALRLRETNKLIE